jgi:hypothetical protein
VYAEGVDHQTMRIEWADNSNNEDGFEVYLGGMTRRVPANTTSYHWTGLTANTFYCSAVRSYNAAGTSAYYPTHYACGSTKQYSPPPVPVLPPAAPSDLTMHLQQFQQIVFQWADNSDNETGFWVEITDGNHVIEQGTIGANSTQMNQGTVGAGVTRCLRIRSYNDGGSSSWSPSTGWVCGQTPPYPAMPSNLTAMIIGANTVRVEWTDNSDNETGFKIRKNPLAFRDVGAGTTSYEWANLPAGEQCFSVASWNLSGYSSYQPSGKGFCVTIP